MCNPYFLAQGCRFAPTLEVHQVGGDVHIGRLIACSCPLVPSPRANGRLTCGPHGAHHVGIPGAEPPSERLARLRPSWSTPDWGFLAPSPRANGSAHLWPSWSMPRYKRTCPTFERIDRQTITCKNITLCRAGTS